MISVYYFWKTYFDDHFIQTGLGNEDLAMSSLAGDLKGTRKATPEIFTDKVSIKQYQLYPTNTSQTFWLLKAELMTLLWKQIMHY